MTFGNKNNEMEHKESYRKLNELNGQVDGGETEIFPCFEDILRRRVKAVARCNQKQISAPKYKTLTSRDLFGRLPNTIQY